MTDKLTPFCKDVMTSANRNGVDALCNLPDWVIAEMMRGIVEAIWMYQRGAVTAAQMVRELNGEEAARREVKQPAAPAPADDLVERLRDEEGGVWWVNPADPTDCRALVDVAADRIEAQAREIADLKADNARLREAMNRALNDMKEMNGPCWVEAVKDLERALASGGDRG